MKVEACLLVQQWGGQVVMITHTYLSLVINENKLKEGLLYDIVSGLSNKT
jgi:hypothetical protein